MRGLFPPNGIRNWFGYFGGKFIGVTLLMKRGIFLLISPLIISLVIFSGLHLFSFVVLSPYAGTYLETLRRNEPTRVTIQELRSQNTSDKILLSEDSKSIRKLISDMEWTWVTSFRRPSTDEKYYSICFEDNSGETIYPFYYYSQSDVIQFLGEDNVFSINSSKILKELLNESNLWFAQR